MKYEITLVLEIDEFSNSLGVDGSPEDVASLVEDLLFEADDLTVLDITVSEA